MTKHERYIYRGYLQIAALDQKRAAHPALWYVLWDPTEAIATRPLAIQKDSTWYTYGHDFTKNVWELYKANGTIASTYDYAPFGGVTANGTAEQPFQWSSEFYDSELGMVYYNFRFYNPLDGRWISRDPMEEEGGVNLYGYADNNSAGQFDILGMAPSRREIERLTKQVKALLRKVEECTRRRSAECCAELYEQYLNQLAELMQKASEFYADQYWKTERDEKAMWEVYGLPTIVGGVRPSREQLEKQKQAAEKARENVNNNIFIKHGEAINNGVNFGSGLSDSLSLGAGRLLATWVHGEDSRWGDTESGWYQGGLWTGTAMWTLAGSGAAIGRYGANSNLIGKGSYLFGRSKYGPKGILNRGPLRLGWSWKGSKLAGKEVFRVSWSTKNSKSYWNHLDFN